ncbi:MAG: MoaD/ThiS family protein [Chitinophagaceae bacterium]
MEIEVFAALKAYFPATFRIETKIPDVAALKQHLVKMNTASESMLGTCRFAVGARLVEEGYALGENDVVAVLPPSSGG